MIDVINLLQTTLDEALLDIPLHSFWKRRPELDDDPNPDEYIVYTVDEHEPGDGADGENLFYRSYAVIRYFCRDSWITDAAHIARIREHMAAIHAALIAAGFECPSAWQDAGDVDGISFEAFVLNAEYQEVERGDG